MTTLQKKQLRRSRIERKRVKQWAYRKLHGDERVQQKLVQRAATLSKPLAPRRPATQRVGFVRKFFSRLAK